MRVLHLYSGNLFGGVEAMLLTIARHRTECPEMEPHFGLCFKGRLESGLREAGAAVEMLGEIRLSRPWTVWMARRRLSQLLDGRIADVVVCHSPWPHAVFAPVVRRASLPLVFWLHDAVEGRHWLERCAGRTPPDLAVCNSRFTASLLPRIYPNAPTECVYCPVAPTDKAMLGAERQVVRRELTTPDDALVIIQAGRMESWKGHRIQLHALGKLRDCPGWMSWMIGGAQKPGEAAYLTELKALATGLGISDKVRFVGQRSDVPRLLAAADVFCQPNTGPEPFGIVFVEALYAGLPVIGTRLGATPEIIDDTCGVLVSVGDAGELSDTLRLLITDKSVRLRLAAGGPSRAEKLCMPAVQLQRLHGLLADLVGRKAAV